MLSSAAVADFLPHSLTLLYTDRLQNETLLSRVQLWISVGLSIVENI